jgi:hypothetical protein
VNASRDDFNASLVIEGIRGIVGDYRADQLYSLAWSVSSQGPDRISRLQEIAIEEGDDPRDVTADHFVIWLIEFSGGDPGIYDPTNGTVSRGDILRTAKGVFEPRHIGL